MTNVINITAENLSKTFEVKASRVPVIKKVNLSIKAGEFVVITGPSGCGKSTLLHILLGLEPPTSGTVALLGKNLYGVLDEDGRTQLRKEHVGMIYQQPNWIKALTVLENVMFALRINGESDEKARTKSQEMLKMVGMLDWQDYIPTELSSGQQQKVALARAVITNPQVIIADEPTGNLDFKSGEELMQLLKKLNSAGKTIIMVTHDLEYLTFASRSLIMFDGQIVEQAESHDLSSKLTGFKKLFGKVDQT
ncbi:MAG: Lipoprotein-releasing system ATP-binding protein LolD [Elusimicrobia bacterium]|nr:Lipoprotein-releasing system ATP-binding protein LolD [Elusimicrobiota bacterium]